MARTASLALLMLLAACARQPEKPMVITGPLVDTPPAHRGPVKTRGEPIPLIPPEKPAPPDTGANAIDQLDDIDQRVRDLQKNLQQRPLTR